MHHAQSIPDPPVVSSLLPDIPISHQECLAKKHFIDVGHSDFSSFLSQSQLSFTSSPISHYCDFPSVPPDSNPPDIPFFIPLPSNPHPCCQRRGL